MGLGGHRFLPLSNEKRATQLIPRMGGGKQLVDSYRFDLWDGINAPATVWPQEDEQMSTQVEDEVMEEIESEVEDATAAVPIYTISSYPTDPTLEVLHMRWQREEIRIPRLIPS